MDVGEQIMASAQDQHTTLEDRIAIAKLYDLGKFCFTAGTATAAFLFTAEKINEVAVWDWRLTSASVALLAATVLSVRMVIAGAPHIKMPLVPEKMALGPTGLVNLWFVLWAAGAVLGIWAVLPSPEVVP